MRKQEEENQMKKNKDCYSSYSSSNPKIAACLLSESLTGVISKKGGIKRSRKKYN